MCGNCSLVVGRGGDKEDNGETAMMMTRAMEMPWKYLSKTIGYLVGEELACYSLNNHSLLGIISVE